MLNRFRRDLAAVEKKQAAASANETLPEAAKRKPCRR